MTESCLYYIIIRPNFHVSNFEDMGVVATKAHPFYEIVSRASDDF